MKDQDTFQAETTKALTDLQKKFEATHDDLVKIIGYALTDVKYAAPPVEEEKPAKSSKANPVSNPVIK